MTATTPPGRPSVQRQPSGATTTAAGGGGVLLVGTRILLWLGVQLEQRLGRPWIAAAIVAALWAAEHAFYPLLVADGRLDLGFAAYRAASVLPFLATWTAAYYALGRRLLPIMAARWVLNGGTALALALGVVG